MVCKAAPGSLADSSSSSASQICAAWDFTAPHSQNAQRRHSERHADFKSVTLLSFTKIFIALSFERAQRA